MTFEDEKTIEQIAMFGLDVVNENETVEVNLKDLMYVFLTLQELQQFFHQPSHYKTLDDISKFMGNVNTQDGFTMISKSIHEKMSKMLPKHLADSFDNGDFDCPIKPPYFKDA
jgi:hypothetical protein